MPALPIGLRAYERENRKPTRGESLAHWPGFLLVNRRSSGAARTTGCDEDEAGFEKRLMKIAKAPAPKDTSSKGAKLRRTK